MPSSAPASSDKAGIARTPVLRLAWLCDAGAGLLALLYAILKAYGLGPALSDEGIYFYMCRRIAEGAIPYQDFFFAHPPFHLIPGSILIALAGYTPEAAKALPALAGLLAGVAVYVAGRRGSPMQGLAAMGLFLFAHDLLRASSHYTGAAEATALLAWALERALAGRPRTAGLLAASAGLVAFYALPAAAAIGIYIFLRRRNETARYALALGGLFLGINLLCALLFRSRYWDPVIRYHFMKPPGGDGNLGSVLRAITMHNVWIVWGLLFFAAAWILTLAGSRRRYSKRGSWLPAGPLEAGFAGLLVSLLHLAFFFMLTRVYTFYFLPGLAGMALAGGAGIVALLHMTTGLAGGDATRRSRRTAAGALVLLALLGAGAIFTRSRLVARVIDEPDGGIVRSYTWKPSPLPERIDALVRALFWNDQWIAGRWPSSVTRYLWHESRRFEAPRALAGIVSRRASPEARLFGDSVATPQVALLSGLVIVHDEADTNAMRFRSRITPAEEMIAGLEEDPPEVVIAAPRRGFYNVAEMRAWVDAHYNVAETFRDPIYGAYSVLLRK